MRFPPSDREEAFGDLLRRLRREAALTQQELAVRSGVSQRAISDLERGINRRPRRDSAAMLADGLGLSEGQRDRFLQAAHRRPVPADARLDRLPELTDPTVGRADELERIVAGLRGDDVRLLTLTGPGGVGKTRLAIEAARFAASDFADGARFVHLDGLSDPALVLQAVAGALGMQERGARPLLDQIANRLARLEMLIVIDNMEHLLPAAGDLAAMLNHARGVTMLVTSRESLRLGGELVMPIAPLPRPDPGLWRGPAGPRVADEPAVALFVDRACAVRPDLEVDPATATGRAHLQAIAAICAWLDGLPLAIELAAAQTEILLPVALLSVLESVGLPMLAEGRRNDPVRLQTMEAAIEWSYSRLTDVEQEAFRALAVFAGGFTFAAAAWVVGPNDLGGVIDPLTGAPAHGADAGTMRAMGSLLRRNLLVQDAGLPGHDAARFRMLEPIRLFARDRLRRSGDEDALLQRHAAYFAALAETLDTLILGPMPERWLPVLEAELANMRAAIDWCQRAGLPELASRLVCFIAQIWEIKGHVSEGRQRVAAAISGESGVPAQLRWFLRFWASVFAFDAGDHGGAADHAADLLRIAKEDGDLTGVGVGLALLSRVVGADDTRRDEAVALAQRAVETLAPLGQDEWTGWAWSRLGIEQHRRGEPAAARDALLTGLAVRRRRQSAGGVSYTLVSLGAVLADLDQPVAARDAYLECLELAARHQNHTLTVTVLTGIADLIWRHGDSAGDRHCALRVFGAAEEIRERHGIGRDRASQAAIDAWLTEIRERVGDREADLLLAQGRATSLPQLGELARNVALAPVATSDPAPLALLCSLASSE